MNPAPNGRAPAPQVSAPVVSPEAAVTTRPLPAPSLRPGDDDACALCALPLRRGRCTLDTPAGLRAFCCQGCRQVYRVLLDSPDAPPPEQFSQTDIFRHCRDIGVIPRDAADPARRSTGNGQARADTSPADDVEQIFQVTGMWCPACAWVIEHALQRLPGLTRVMCNFSADRLVCRYDPRRTRPDDIAAAVGRLGYQAALPAIDGRHRRHRAEMVRFGVAVFLTLNVMMLSFALYTGFFSALPAGAVRKLSWPLMVMAAGVLFYSGRRIHRRAVSGLRAGSPGMETLVSIGALSAFGYSTANLLRGSLHLYFDTASMLVTLVLLGKLLEGRAKREVQDYLEAFFNLAPRKVRLWRPETPRGRYVDAAALAAGDRFIVEEGDIAAADGVVVRGRAHADEAGITGEPEPVPKQAGASILSGTRILHGRLQVRATAVGPEATLNQMIALMQRALDRKTTLEGRTDALLRAFVPLVVLLAIATGLALALRDASGAAAFERALTVLVISCPCALGIAIPLARVVGIAAASRLGVLVRHFEAFERADRVTTVVLDKTGTVTRGQWRLQHVDRRAPFTAGEIWSVALALELTGEHPVAVEIRRRAHADGIRPAALTERRAAPDGVSARAGQRDVRIGSRTFAGQGFGPSTGAAAPAAAAVRSRVYLTIGGRPAAVFHFGDRLRPEAAGTLAALRRDGRDLVLVSGDDAAITADVARRLGIRHHRGGASPDVKAAHVAALQQQGQWVAAVGDGINDAPALVQAQVGIAVNTGASLAREAADVTLLGGRLTALPGFLRLSCRVNRKIQQNLAGAFVYNLLSIPLAMAGWLTPLLAVSAMLLSSLSVIGNTLGLMRGAHAPGTPIPRPPPGGGGDKDPSDAAGSGQNDR